MNEKDSRNTLRWFDEELIRKLTAKGVLAQAGIDKALASCGEFNHSMAEAIVSLNLLPRQTVYEELAGIHGVPYIELQGYGYDPMVLSLIDEKTARELEVFPLFIIGNSLTVAVADPSDITAMDRITSVSRHAVETCLAAPADIRAAINRGYGESGEVKEFIASMQDKKADGSSESATQPKGLNDDESPVSRLVNLILAQAVRDRASDIHIDPEENNLKIRFRIDGILYEIPPPPKHLHPFIISRLKVMSSMDIAETRMPQDGSFKTSVEGRAMEARVSSMPTIHGENMAIRLLDIEGVSLTMENLGASDRLLADIESLIHRPHGMLVVSGPTGSGKSTTLYALLIKIRSPERHVISIEDPVERHINMVTQIQVNEKANLTFASALRGILRQDPDVLMVGEIRDPETAQLSVRAALTGHLVLSTAHTNDAPGVITRLVNMGIEPFLIASSLLGAIGQRLCRCICRECKAEHSIPDGIRKRLQTSGIPVPETIWRGKGCSACRNTGYSGRMGVFESMSVTPDLAVLISENSSSAELRSQARKDGMRSLLEDGIDKAARGITTLEEIFRIAELESVADIRPAPAVPTTGSPAVAPEAAKTFIEAASLNLDDYKQKMSNWLSSRSR